MKNKFKVKISKCITLLLVTIILGYAFINRTNESSKEVAQLIEKKA